MPWSAVVGAVAGNVVGSVLSDGSSSGGGSSSGQTYDPYMSYRPEAAKLYSQNLTKANADITKMPGYAQYLSGVMNPAMNAAQAQSAATGQLYSGAETAALQNLGQQGFYSFYTDYMNRLAQASGATQSPAAAASGALNSQMYQNQLQGQMAGAISQGVGSIYNYGKSSGWWGSTSNTGNTSSYGMSYGDGNINWGNDATASLSW